MVVIKLVMVSSTLTRFGPCFGESSLVELRLVAAVGPRMRVVANGLPGSCEGGVACWLAVGITFSQDHNARIATCATEQKIYKVLVMWVAGESGIWVYRLLSGY